jgi:hypothetical protein
MYAGFSRVGPALAGLADAGQWPAARGEMMRCGARAAVAGWVTAVGRVLLGI